MRRRSKLTQKHDYIVSKILNHDWSFDYSEEIRVARAGYAERKELLTLFKELPPHEREFMLQFLPQGWEAEFRAQLQTELGAWKPLKEDL